MAQHHGCRPPSKDTEAVRVAAGTRRRRGEPGARSGGVARGGVCRGRAVGGGRYLNYRPPLGSSKPFDQTCMAWIKQGRILTWPFPVLGAGGRVQRNAAAWRAATPCLGTAVQPPRPLDGSPARGIVDDGSRRNQQRPLRVFVPCAGDAGRHAVASEAAINHGARLVFQRLCLD